MIKERKIGTDYDCYEGVRGTWGRGGEGREGGEGGLVLPPPPPPTPRSLPRLDWSDLSKIIREEISVIRSAPLLCATRIGRAACRERGEISVVAVSLKKKKKKKIK